MARLTIFIPDDVYRTIRKRCLVEHRPVGGQIVRLAELGLAVEEASEKRREDALQAAITKVSRSLVSL